jgi:hypothetical protein
VLFRADREGLSIYMHFTDQRSLVEIGHAR